MVRVLQSLGREADLSSGVSVVAEDKHDFFELGVEVLRGFLSSDGLEGEGAVSLLLDELHFEAVEVLVEVLLLFKAFVQGFLQLLYFTLYTPL